MRGLRLFVLVLSVSLCATALGGQRERVEGWVGAMVGCATCKRQGEPTPAPKPVDGTKCTNCDGTGVLPGDGTIKPQCPVCGGDGRVGKPASKPAAKAVKSVVKKPAAAVNDSGSNCVGGKCYSPSSAPFQRWSLFRR